LKIFSKVLVLTVTILSALTVTLGWSIYTLFSALLTSITLVLVRDGLRSRSKLRSLLIIAWLYWGLSYVSNLIEAVYFAVIPPRAARLSALFGLILVLTTAGLLEVMTAQRDAPHERRTILTAGVAWRIPVLAFAFFVIYLAAGIAIHPWIASFYAHRHLPTLTQLLRLQLCRGVLDLSCIYPVYRLWRKSRTRAVWVSACVFTVLCGWGPLLLPNQFLPGPIRLAHAVEMGASGIVFGIITALLLLKPAHRSVEVDGVVAR
jgi:hypothetical protein